MEGAAGFIGNGIFHAVRELEEDEKKSSFKTAADGDGDESGKRHEDIDIDLEIFQVVERGDQSGNAGEKIDKREKEIGEGSVDERKAKGQSEKKSGS